MQSQQLSITFSVDSTPTYIVSVGEIRYKSSKHLHVYRTDYDTTRQTTRKTKKKQCRQLEYVAWQTAGYGSKKRYASDKNKTSRWTETKGFPTNFVISITNCLSWRRLAENSNHQ